MEDIGRDSLQDKVVTYELGGWLDNMSIVGLLRILDKDIDSYKITTNGRKIEIPLNYFLDYSKKYFDYFIKEYDGKFVIDRVARGLREYLIRSEDVLSEFTMENIEKALEPVVRDEFTTYAKKESAYILDWYKKKGYDKKEVFQAVKKFDVIKKKDYVKAEKQGTLGELKKIYQDRMKVAKEFYEMLLDDLNGDNSFKHFELVFGKVSRIGICEINFVNASSAKVLRESLNSSEDILDWFYEKYVSGFVNSFNLSEKEMKDDKTQIYGYRLGERIYQQTKKEYDYLLTLRHLQSFGISDVQRKYSCEYGVDSPSKISSIDTKLAFLYLNIPVGMNIIGNKMIFLNSSTKIKQIYKENNYLKELLKSSKGSQFGAYFQYLRSSEYLKKITIGEQIIDGEINDGKGRYKVIRLDRGIIHQLNRVSKRLEGLVYLYRDEGYVVDTVMREIYAKRYIDDYITTILLKYRISNLSGKYDKKLYRQLVEINEEMYISNAEGDERERMKETLEKLRKTGYIMKMKTTAKSGNDRKTQSYVYKLLQSLRINDRETFIDTLLNISMYCGVSVPKELILSSIEDNTFKLYGQSLVSGMILSDFDKVEKVDSNKK